jgi:hypothetical protein
MANKRVFYAAKKAGIGPVGSASIHAGGSSFGDHKAVAAAPGSFRQLHGLQSLGMTTTFNLEQTFELGQLAIYENIEGVPDISVDVEKVLDGYCPIYPLATSVNTTDGVGDFISTSASLVGRSNAKCDLCVAIFKDTVELATDGDNRTTASSTYDYVDGTGTHTSYIENPETHVMMSGLFVNSVSYNVGIDGYATESVSLVGQDKVWHGVADGYGKGLYNNRKARWSQTDFITSEDEPLSLTRGSGGVNRREDVLFVYPGNGNVGPCRDKNGSVSGLGTVLPTEIPGISASGTNDKTGDTFNAHIQSISCSTDLGREDIFELGRKGRYHRFVSFPTEVTCEITAISASGDLISATEEGWVDKPNQGNLVDQTIRLHLREGLLVDLGKKNKLSSVSVTGGDAGGGNEEITYSYTNFNDMTVYHPQDPMFKQPSDGDSYKASKFTPRDGRAVNGVGVLLASTAVV